jgi:hypothetical protein
MVRHLNGPVAREEVEEFNALQISLICAKMPIAVRQDLIMIVRLQRLIAIKTKVA